MSERSYTVSEIDALRSVVETKYLYGSYRGRGGWSRPHNERDMSRDVAEAVRCHMLAGRTAQDLLNTEPEGEDHARR